MKLFLISDFNADNFAGYLRNVPSPRKFAVTVAPFGQVQQVVLDSASEYWKSQADCCIVWTRPESALPSFYALLEGDDVSPDLILKEVDNFVELLAVAKKHCSLVIVPTWVMAAHHTGHGIGDLANPSGAVRCLMAANLRLLDAVDMRPGIYALSAAKWIEFSGPAAYNPRLWFGAKVPFGNEVFKHAARDVAAALSSLHGRSRKLILLDLDDTLWGGTVGESGWHSLVLGGHDPIGEALADFQTELRRLSRRGIALGILSKNDQTVALEAIRQNPEMILRLDDFAGWRINWNDKATNLAELVRELNLGLDSVVFLDDNPVERARIREAFPDVLVPELPEDKRLYSQTLLSLDCFSKPAITAEDKERVKMYTIERKRSEVRSEATSFEQWLEGLEMVVNVSPLDGNNIVRVVQLLNKTNQMNLATRRLTESELTAFASRAGTKTFAIRVTDRFGDSGLTGVLSVETDGQSATITDFVLSCRVMGRHVEESMLHTAVHWARQAGLKSVKAFYRPTARNQPCLEFFRRSGFTEVSEHQFIWDATSAYPREQAIKLISTDKNSVVLPAVSTAFLHA